MEYESHLNEMMANLPGDNASEKSNQIIEDFEQQKFKKYFDILKHAVNLRSQGQIGEEKLDEVTDKLIDTSEQEFGQPLNILELEKKT